MLKKIAAFLVLGILAVPGIALGVPSLGVATDYGYVSGGEDTEYFHFWDPGMIGYGVEGWVIGPSGSTLHVWSHYDPTATDIYLLWTSAIESAGNPSISGDDGSFVATQGQIDGYKPTSTQGEDIGYYGVLLPKVGWISLDSTTDPDNVFNPDPFWYLDVTLSYSGVLPLYQYIFASADVNGLAGLQFGSNGKKDGYGPDDFSPKTSSARVPEPGTLLLLGFGLVCVAGWGRKRARS